MTLGVIMGVLPLAIVVEPALLSDPSPFVVHTSIEISAPPPAVWRHLLAFDAIPAPTEWLFRAGIAYPISAALAGRGVGAIRSCQFSTGVFVEPIEVWEEGRRLKFSVAATPPPLREWSPYRHVHPLHLDGYFVPRSADFQLTALEAGRTRLDATSVYANRMRPRAYWGLWSDAIVHRVHARVFEQIKRLAERDAGTTSLATSQAPTWHRR